MNHNAHLGASEREFIPLYDAVHVRIEKPERMTASKLLWIPETAQRQPYELYQATVLAVGDGAYRKCDGQKNPMEVKVGDRVLVYWAGLELPHITEGDDCWISEKSIQCVIQ